MNSLEIAQLTVRFGGLTAVDNLQFSVASHSIHSLIGPNGAGKTTVINTIVGLNPAARGTIRYLNEDILGLPPHAIARAGIARTFQNVELFGEMTVLENVMVGLHGRLRSGCLGAMLRTPRFRRGEDEASAEAKSLLDTIGMTAEADMPAANLPFGKQRLLEMARALATRPKLLLLDEPAAGLRAGEIEALNLRLLSLRDRYGLTILLVDHVMRVIMNISDRVTVLNFGRKIAEGSVGEVRADPEVRRAYLGSGADHAGSS